MTAVSLLRPLVKIFCCIWYFAFNLCGFEFLFRYPVYYFLEFLCSWLMSFINSGKFLAIYMFTYLIWEILSNRSITPSSVQYSSVAQSCLTLCDPMDSSIPGLPVHHQLPEFTQTLVHWVGDAIQPSHPLSFPSPPTFNLS